MRPHLSLLVLALLFTGLVVLPIGDSQVPGGIAPPISLTGIEDICVFHEFLQAERANWISVISSGFELQEIRFRRLLDTPTHRVYFSRWYWNALSSAPAFSVSTPVGEGWFQAAYVHEVSQPAELPPDFLFVGGAAGRPPSTGRTPIRTTMELEFLIHVIAQVGSPDPGSPLAIVHDWVASNALWTLSEISVQTLGGRVVADLTFRSPSATGTLVENFQVSALPAGGSFDGLVVQ